MLLKLLDNQCKNDISLIETKIFVSYVVTTVNRTGNI